MERYATEPIAKQLLRVRYVTQVTTRPPSFVAFVSGSEAFPASSIRFLGKSLREKFGFAGVPLRMDMRMRKRVRRVPGAEAKRTGKGASQRPKSAGPSPKREQMARQLPPPSKKRRPSFE